MQWTRLFKNKQWARPEERAILLICMGIALLFWIFIKLSQDYSASKTIQFEVIIPGDKTLVELPPNDMKIEMWGSGWDLLYDFFVAAKVQLTYNMEQSSSLSRSRNQLLSDIRNQLYSRSLEIRALNYEGVQFQLDDKHSKQVPVQLQADIRYAPGYQARMEPQLEPDSVVLTGPASLLRSFDYWKTDSVYLSDLSVDVSRQLALQERPPTLVIQPATVSLSVSTEQFTEHSLFVPLTIENAPDSVLRIFPRNVSVSYIVGLTAFNSISADDFTIIADFTGVDLHNNPINEVPVKLVQHPDQVRNVNINPQTARYFILKDSLQQEN